MARAPRRRSKYGNVKTTVDGTMFDSKAEAQRWCELKLLEKAGKIGHVYRQNDWALIVEGGRRVGFYRPDFEYFKKGDDTITIEDVKGYMTPLSRWKIKHLEAQYGIKVVIIRKGQPVTEVSRSRR